MAVVVIRRDTLGQKLSPNLHLVDIFNLGCNEQDTPELVMRKSDGGREFSRQVVGLMLLTDGTIHRVHDATIAEPARLAGSAGVGVAGNALLLLSDGKFRMQPYDRVGWTRRTL